MASFFKKLAHDFKAAFYAMQNSKEQTSKTSPVYIDLTSENIARILPDSENVESMLANGFTSKKAPEFNLVSYYKNNQHKWFGDSYIPLKNVSTYYGVENNKLKAGNLNTFADTTVVIPNRIKNIGKVNEVFIDPKGVQYVTTTGDTINERSLGIVGPKRMFADENGNAVFMSKLHPDHVQQLNQKLQQTPLYSVLIDNGRYQSYMLSNPNWFDYTSHDWFRDEDDLYIIGTLYKQGGKFNYFKYLNKNVLDK